MAYSSNWGDGLPTEIMLQIVDTVKDRMDVEMFAACAQVNKHWNLASQPDFCEELCVDTVSDYELYSLTKMVKGAKHVEFRGSSSNSDIVFKYIAEGFPDLLSLRVENMRLTDEGLEHIASVAKLEKLQLDVISFSPSGIMKLAKVRNLRLYAHSSETGHKFTVDPSSGNRVNLLYEEYMVYTPNGKHVLYGGFGRLVDDYDDLDYVDFNARYFDGF
jgi:hypothetical protein